MSVFSAICVLGLAISLWLTLRQRGPVSRRAIGVLLQSAIWLLVWALFEPPSLLPPETAVTQEVTLTPGMDTQPPLEKLAAAKSLRVTGDGLSRDALRDFPPVRLQGEEVTDKPGWQVAWSREVILGEPLQLDISLQGGYQRPLKLTLEDPFGGAVDSAQLGAEDRHAKMQAWPKMVGNWQYRVRIDEIAENDEATADTQVTPIVARNEILPVIVREAQNPRVLLWLSRPGFETGALARWLRQSATPTQVVTQLAPEMQRRETFNGQPLRKNDLLAADSPFDLLILDSRLWPQLSTAQRRQLATLSQSKSLLWLVDNDSPRGFIDYASAQGMPLDSIAVASAAYGTDTATTAQQAPTLQLAGFRPREIRSGDSRLATGEHTLYWARVQPQQSLGFVFFRNSYRWQTAGLASEFALLWKQLLDHQLALRGTYGEITLSTPLPRAQQRLTLCSSEFSETPPELKVLDLDQNAENEARNKPLQTVAASSSEQGRCYNYWPQQPGWYQLGTTSFALYVFAQDAWSEWQTAITRTESAQMSSARLGPQQQVLADTKPIPLSWIALALLALLSMTWWRERSSLR
ncbi:hypothetical protein PVT68_10620 [Microbulbifer bruguierae]|uniref:Aerotolerance regulator N-terminal domain-containing protein n=1 Tax=Microbulbifer bruguierae TaxID=3029061 RepID=A0ABY8NCS3_9GAMM|nr:hypothetical protein [Microbulbifer bruguierae]WGL15228.1 hypothetical protein PVT68_10620 [Microbulbifer bruguierae]